MEIAPLCNFYGVGYRVCGHYNGRTFMATARIHENDLNNVNKCEIESYLRSAVYNHLVKYSKSKPWDNMGERLIGLGECAWSLVKGPALIHFLTLGTLEGDHPDLYNKADWSSENTNINNSSE